MNGTDVPYSAQYLNDTTPTFADLLGDTDEGYDAADYNNMFLSYRESGADSSEDIIPSFHRPSLINYIINWKKDPVTGAPLSPTTWTEEEFLVTLRRIEMATLRPLSYSVETDRMSLRTRNPLFTGGNAGSTTASPHFEMTIDDDWSSAWPPYWGSSTAPGPFQQWVNSLVLGPWDVDNDKDGVLDGIWIDPDLPLETSQDGRLLKVLVSYYVDDLDGRLDVNATGSLAQVNNRAGGFYNSAVGFQFADEVDDSSFYRTYDTTTPDLYLPQGFGVGPAEISTRHLFGKASIATAFPYLDEIRYRDFLRGRYRPFRRSGSFWPGRGGADAYAELAATRERRAAFVHGELPGLPIDPHGRASVDLDVLGNPRIWNISSHVNETTNDPYEAAFMRGGNQDSPYTLAEFERIYRVFDADRALLPDRLQEAMGESNLTLPSSSLRHESQATRGTSACRPWPRVGCEEILPHRLTKCNRCFHHIRTREF